MQRLIEFMNYKKYITVVLVSGLLNPFYIHAQENQQSFIKKHGKKIGASVGILVLTCVGAGSCWYLTKKWKNRKKNEDEDQKNLGEESQTNFAEQEKEFLNALAQKDFTKINELISQGIVPDDKDLPRKGNVLHELIMAWQPDNHEDIKPLMINVLGIMQINSLNQCDQSEGKTPLALLINQMQKHEFQLDKLFELSDMLVQKGANPDDESVNKARGQLTSNMDCWFKVNDYFRERYA
jgi:hypothetical protein